MKLLAAGGSGQNMGTIGGGGLGPFAAHPAGSGTAALSQVTSTVSAIIGFMTVAAGIWFMFEMLFSGYEWISAGGDAKKLETARERLTHGFMGLLIVVGAWALLAVTGQFLGYDILVSNPGAIIQSIQLH
jgi:hypothetical protein